MKILLIGHSGYVGNILLHKLSKTTHNIICLSRRVINEIIYPNIRFEKGDIINPDSYLYLLESCDAIIYLPGLIREFPEKGITFEGIHFLGVKYLVDAAVEKGIKRFILMSANGVRENASTGYLRTKYQAEEYLKKSRMDWTIFRPSVIFGYEKIKKKNFINVIIELSRFPIFFPVIGNGNYRLQPVSLDNLTDAIVMSIDNPLSINKTYHACGKKIYSYNEIVDILLSVIKKKRVKIHIPVFIMDFIAGIFEKYEMFPVSRDQIKMLLEENICNGGLSIFDDFQITPIDFVEEMKKQFDVI